MDDIYLDTHILTTFELNVKNFKKNLEEFILSNLKENIENKCINEGFIEQDSIKIIKRSVPYVYGSQFNGHLKIKIIYSAKVCYPVKNNIITCEINKINKLGILANKGPLSIIVAKEFHSNKKIFDNLKEGDQIKIIIIDKKFEINDTKISVIAKLYEDKIDNIINKSELNSANNIKSLNIKEEINKPVEDTDTDVSVEDTDSGEETEDIENELSNDSENEEELDIDDKSSDTSSIIHDSSSEDELDDVPNTIKNKLNMELSDSSDDSSD